jgi:hypothetical protein
MSLVGAMCRSTININLDSEVSTPSPITKSYESVKIPSQALAPLQSFTHTPPQTSGFPSRQADQQNSASAPSEVFSPSTFSQKHGATYIQRFPNRWLRCVLRVSHPLDALLPTRPAELISSRYRSWGSPFEALIPAQRRTPFQTPGPSWSSTGSEEPVRPSRGSTRYAKPAHGVWGLTKTPRRVPP